MKFQKRNAALRWWAWFKQLTNIRAYAQVPDDDHFYACGDYNTNELLPNPGSQTDLTTATYTAGLFRITN